jgi:hypothetical protein
LKFLGLGVDLVLGDDTQNDRDRTEDNSKDDQTDDAAHHRRNGHAARRLDGMGCHGMARRDGGGLGGLGHVAGDFMLVACSDYVAYGTLGKTKRLKQKPSRARLRNGEGYVA